MLKQYIKEYGKAAPSKWALRSQAAICHHHYE